jgi:hypothetical protein
MTYNLFLDDERQPVTDKWKIARSSKEAINYLYEFGIPQEIAFDHDLGGGDTSMNYINALVDYLILKQQRLPEGFKFSIHSQNPVGAANISSMMKQIIAYYN